MSNAGLFKGYVIDPGSVGYDDVGRDNIHSVLLTHGHTLGEYGFTTEDGVLYSGDSLYSKEIRESLHKIKKLDFDYVVPGHGDPMKRDEVLKAADFHLGELDRVDNIILDLIEEPVSTESLVTKFSHKMGLFKNLNNYWLTVVMLKGHLSSLNNKGKVAYKLGNYCMYWYRI